VTPFTLMAALGATIVQGRPHTDAWDLLETEQPPGGSWAMGDWYPDARPCIERLRATGIRVCASGNTPAAAENELREAVDAVGSSASWGVAKPSPGFFRRVIELAGVPAGRIAYVGDRVDNDVEPALAAGLRAVHVRRGPWGHLQIPPEAAIRIRSLDELPEVLQ
jgi:HAD superfamily hydrolase (TIGR01509 family)